MSKKDTITVYWSPGSFTSSEQSWNQLYREPESLLKNMIASRSSIRSRKDNMLLCPAVKDTMSNVFVIKNNLDNVVDIPDGLLDQYIDLEGNRDNLNVQSSIGILVPRRSTFEGHINIEYNMSWLLFADEPVEVKITAPYFPSAGPCDGALLATGKFNIGKWYRHINLDYHIPLDTKQLSFLSGDPLIYLEFITDKKIIFKRYTLTQQLMSMAKESSGSGTFYGKLKSLKYRYDMAHKSNIPTIVLSEIKKNLIE